MKMEKLVRDHAILVYNKAHISVALDNLGAARRSLLDLVDMDLKKKENDAYEILEDYLEDVHMSQQSIEKFMKERCEIAPKKADQPDVY